MSNSYYNPRPPRVWSRVQNQCTYADASNNVYQSVYIPLTKQTVTLAQANYEDKLLQKGNILQYKGNSSQLTKKQKYSQLAKGFGPNRTKVFATQSETYTNPNTTGLLRVNSSILPFPNDLVGQPNNISGPFQYAVPNPNGCTGLSIQDGGNLVCGTYANPCTGEIIQTGATSSVICNPASASNVPGSATLCWDTKVQTWFPRQRYFMNNSGTKWPQGYKGFVSAVTLDVLVLTYAADSNCGTISLIWTQPIKCVTTYHIYVNNKLYTTTPPNVFTYSFTETVGVYTIYITAVTGNVESAPSNTLEVIVIPEGTIVGETSLSLSRYYANGYYGLIIQTTLPATTTKAYGIGTFTICVGINDVSILMVGGGGGGASGYAEGDGYGGGGGGGGGINYITGFSPPINTVITLKVGAGGSVRQANQGVGNAAGYPGADSSISYSSIIVTSSGGGEGFGLGTTTVGGGIGGNGQKTGSIIGTYNGYGGGGGGGAVESTGGNVLKPGPGGVGSPAPANDGQIGGAGSKLGPAGSGGSEVVYTYNLPFLPPSSQTIYVSGGGGGGGYNLGGLAGNGVGGGGQSASGVSGQDAINYGGGGGGGAGRYTDDPANNYGGKGGSGFIAIWWPG